MAVPDMYGERRQEGRGQSFSPSLIVFDSDWDDEFSCAGNISECGVWSSCPGDSVASHTTLIFIFEDERKQQVSK